MNYAVRMKCTTGTQTVRPALSEDSLITVSMLKTVLSILSDLQKKVNFINAVYKDTAAARNTGSELDSYSENNLRPVKTIEELNELEKRANCENFVWAVVNSLGRVHGKDRHIGNGISICMQLVDKFFDQDFLGGCTWSNALEKDKIALVDFEKTLSILYQTVVYCDPDFTAMDMRNILQNCMQAATAKREQTNGSNAEEPKSTTTPKRKPLRRKQNQRKVNGKQNRNLPEGPADSPKVCITLSDDDEIELSSTVVNTAKSSEPVIVGSQPANTVLSSYVPKPEPIVMQSFTTPGSPKDRKATNVSALVSVDYSIVPPFLNKIFSPVKSLEELCALEKKASNEGFASAVVVCLGKNHGQNTSHGEGRIVCERLLTTFFDPSFLRQCTWTKAGNEQERTALEEYTQTFLLYYRTVIFSAPDFTLTDLENFMMSVVADSTSSPNKQSLVQVCVAVPEEPNELIREEIVEMIEEETKVATQEATSETDVTALESMNIDNLIETVHIDEAEADFLFDEFIEEEVVYEEDVCMIQEEDVSEYSYQETNNIDVTKRTEVAAEAIKDTEKSISQRTRSKVFSPVTCLEELVELEKNACKDAFVLSVVNCLGRVHGFRGKGDAKMVCQRLVNRFFNEKFLRQCYWIGINSDKTKICLANYTNTINLFYQTVRFTDPDFTQLQAKAFISRLLHQYNSSPGAARGKRRKSKNENSIDDVVYGEQIKTKKSDDSDMEFSYEIDYIDVPESSEVLEQLAKICFNT
ncbi:uncharacterized protein LOC131215388 [Anopheles bellator]|uniref:uncharacterized protein LOC131215388 n=1 Tax=Anopheles bellator TaxID=139047 RepID=UPI00264A423B|nr:uncharacterized protein LOC131215388 [Anopheles bellator]